MNEPAHFDASHGAFDPLVEEARHEPPDDPDYSPAHVIIAIRQCLTFIGDHGSDSICRGCFDGHHEAALRHHLDELLEVREFDLGKPMGENQNESPLSVNWKDQAHLGPGWKSMCPVCPDGVLPVQRNHELLIQRTDRCMWCAQQFIYLDVEEMRTLDTGGKSHEEGV